MCAKGLTQDHAERGQRSEKQHRRARPGHCCSERCARLPVGIQYLAQPVQNVSHRSPGV
jgi:hypothetical protein